jgi:hypothetical protein
MLPESPRWLVSQDREDDAFAVLTKYHAEGDASSAIVQAEMAQIRSTIKIELENSKQSWMDMLRSAGMRRRVLISSMMGLFTQMSGNTLLSYYSGLLFEMMGYTTNYAKTRINIANNCWSFINGTIIALVVPRFKRRWMFMLSAGSMTCVFVAMTISFQRLAVADAGGYVNNPAAISALIWYFAYSPTYNIGNNSLTYSKFHIASFLHTVLTCGSLSRRTFPLRTEDYGYRSRANLRQIGRLLLHQRQSHCPQGHWMEIHGHLLRLDLLRVHVHLHLLPGNSWTHTRGTCFL